MAKDILITPAAGTIDFYDTSNSYNTATIGFGESQTTGALSVYHDGSGINVLNRLNTGVVFEVYGTNGTLFSLDDDLSDSLFAVANSAGLPVFEVFADNSIVGGSYGSNDFYLDSNGNLGLGTSSPTRKLHIKGDNEVFLLSSNDYEVATIGPRGSSGSNLDAGILGVKANGTFKAVIDAAGSTYFNGGSVGVGTTSPSTQTHIYGTLTVDSSGNSTTSYTEGIRLGASSNGYSIINYGANASASSGSQAGQWWAGKHGSNGGFNFWNATSSDVFHIKLDGNVGIGTMTPSAPLHVIGDAIINNGSPANSNMPLTVGAAGSNFQTVAQFGSSDQAIYITNASPIITAGIYYNNGWIGTNTTSTLINFAGGVFDFQIGSGSVGGLHSMASHMKLTSTGLGIGGVTPAHRLHVNGNSLVTGNTYIGDTARYFKSNGNGVLLQTAHGYLFFGPDNSSWGHIQTDRANFYFNKSLAVNGGMIQSYDENLVLNAAVDTARAIEFRSGGTTYMYMTAGSLGIGTTSPTQKLHVVGHTYIAGNLGIGTSSPTGNLHIQKSTAGALFESSGSTNYTGITYLADTSNNFWNSSIILNNANGIFEIRNNSSSAAIAINTSGNVGINTTTPSQKLHVNGNVTATAYYGDGSNLTGISTSSSSNTQSQKSGTTTLTLNVGSYALHVVPLASGTTISSITYSSAPSSGTVSSIIVILKYSGTATVTWTNVIWSGGVTPTLTGSSGKGDVFSLTSYNGGSNWIGAVIAQNLDSTNL